MTNEKFQSCIATCSDCAIECSKCINSCLHETDIKMLVLCIKLNQDCADICHLAVKLMARDSGFAKMICGICAEVCNACAAECEKHSHMEHCKNCAETCRKCAEECSKMSHC